MGQLSTPLPPGRQPGAPYRVTFVCTGNICRSPMAEVITAALAQRTHLADGTALGAHLELSSAGTGPWHVGEAMDERTAVALSARGFPDPGHRAAHIKAAAALGRYDLVVGLDRSHVETLRSLGGGTEAARLVLLRSFDPRAGGALDVPDPYYGDASDFADCCAMVESACRGLVGALAAHLDPAPARERALSDTFTKTRADAPAGFFAAEAAGLAWLAEPAGVAVPRVRAVTDTSITIDRVPAGQASLEGAEAFGRALADLHATGAGGFGAPWPGFIGPLPMDNTPVPGSAYRWADFYAERRVLPFLGLARDQGALDRAGTEAIDSVLSRLGELAGPEEPPSRLHGDLWSGNVLWDSSGTAWLIDPAAHGGHRETDLAMLALFGCPHLDRLLSAYDEQRPLAEGWRRRVALHQLHPLVVHAVLFGPGYGRQAVEAARRCA